MPFQWEEQFGEKWRPILKYRDTETIMAEPVEMPFGMKTRVDPRNHVLDGGLYPPTGRSTFEGCPSHREPL